VVLYFLYGFLADQTVKYKAEITKKGPFLNIKPILAITGTVYENNGQNSPDIYKETNIFIYSKFKTQT
jgi:hypothetical protein